MSTDHDTLDVDEQLRAFAVALENRTTEPIRPGTRTDDDHVARVTVEPIRTPPGPDRRRWVWAAAAAVAAVLTVAVLITVGDDTAPSDTPEPTDPPTTSVPDDTEQPPNPADAAVVDQFFTTYNAGDIDGVLAMLATDAAVTRNYGGTRPDPDGEPISAVDLELELAWNLAQGEELTEPDCHVAEEQPAAGVRLDCIYTTRDALVQALVQPLDATGVPTRTLITIADGQITELHHGYGSPDFATYGRPFDAWMEENHPEVDGALCCLGETREESVARGELRAQWAPEWASALAEPRDGSTAASPEPVATVPALDVPVDGGVQQSLVGDINWTRVEGDATTVPADIAFELDGVFYGNRRSFGTIDNGEPQSHWSTSPDGVVWTAWDDAPSDAELAVAADTIWATAAVRGAEPALGYWDGAAIVPVDLPAPEEPSVGEGLVVSFPHFEIVAELEDEVVVERVGVLRVPWEQLLPIESPLSAMEEGGTWSGTFRVRAMNCDGQGGCGWSEPSPPPTWNIRPEVVEGSPTRIDLYDDATGELVTSIVPPDDGRPIEDVVFGIGAENVAGRRVDRFIVAADGSSARRADWALAPSTYDSIDFAGLGERLFALTEGEASGDGLRLWVTDDLEQWEELPAPARIDLHGFSRLSSDGSTMILVTSSPYGPNGRFVKDQPMWVTTDGTTWTAWEQVLTGIWTRGPTSADFGWIDSHDGLIDLETLIESPSLVISPDVETWQIIPIPLPAAMTERGLTWADLDPESDPAGVWDWEASAHGDTIFVGLRSWELGEPHELWVGRVNAP